MAQYAIFLNYPKDAMTTDPDQLAAEQAEHTRHGQELNDSGVMVYGSPLEDVEASTSIRATGVVDGPYVETKEVVVGFYVIDVPDLDAALELAGRNPIIRQGGGVEVRPLAGGCDIT